jgi:hypothetical protein
MARRKGAPRLTESEDPVVFVLRNRPAQNALETLRGQPRMTPLTLRKATDTHPEKFRRLISGLNDVALISIRALPQARPKRGRRSLTFQVPIGIGLTRTGDNVVTLANEIRDHVRRRQELLPGASEHHWLRAT